jgi:hypothetical protein
MKNTPRTLGVKACTNKVFIVEDPNPKDPQDNGMKYK